VFRVARYEILHFGRSDSIDFFDLPADLSAEPVW